MKTKNKVPKLSAKSLQKAWDEGCSDTKKVLENLYPNFFEKEETYSIGDRFIIEDNEFILGYTGDVDGSDTVTFIDIETGVRFWGAFRTDNISDITTSEIKKLLCTEPFKKIKS